MDVAKGPLIDPIAPYAPENAQWLFSIGLCSIINVYLLLLFTVRHQTRRHWLPVLCFLVSTTVTELGMQLYLSQTQQSYFRPHHTLSWIVRPNLIDFPNQTGGGVLNTNRDSMRAAREWTDKASAFRILILGDSSNFGHGVSDDEIWSAGEQILGQGHGCRSLQRRLPGWTTHQGLQALNQCKYGPTWWLAPIILDQTSCQIRHAPPQRWRRKVNGFLFRSEALSSRQRSDPFNFRRFSSRAQADTD